MNSESPIALIGVGTAGCAIAHGVRRAFGSDIRCILADTDAATGDSGEPFVLLGGERLSGRGAGGDIVAGRLAAEGSIKAMDEHLEGLRLAVIVTALGGGTGGGATLEAAKHLGDLGIPSVVFATTPFSFEGDDRKRNARGMTTMIEDAANATFFLPLDKLVGDTDNMADAMRRAIDVVAGGVTLFWRLVEKLATAVADAAAGDGEDAAAERLRHLLSVAGRGRFATVTTQGHNRAAAAVEKILKSDMLALSSNPVRAVLCGVLAGDDLLLSEVGQIADGVRGAFGGHTFDLATVNDEATFSGRISVVAMLFEGGSRQEAESRPGSVMSGRRRQKGILAVGPTGRGRFKNAEPTIWHDEDLDVPTFIRKGFSLDF